MAHEFVSPRGILLKSLTANSLVVLDSNKITDSVVVSGEAALDVSSGVVTLSNAAVIGKVLTGYVSGAGTVSATDTILEAIQKLNGNIGAVSGWATAGTTTLTANTFINVDENYLVFKSPAGTGRFIVSDGLDIFDRISLTSITANNFHSADINITATSALNLSIAGSLGTSGQVLTSDGSTATWQTSASGAISALTAAAGTNTINNAAYEQEWQWNTLAGASGLKLTSTSTLAASNLQALLEVNLSGANANSTQTTYAGRFINTHTGTSSTNIAGYFSASGATNNYGLYVGAGDAHLGSGTISAYGVGLTCPTARTANFTNSGNPSTGQRNSYGFLTSGNTTATSGDQKLMHFANNGFVVSSGTATYTMLNLYNVINQTGTASGAVYGINYDPLVTSVLGDHIAFRAVSGSVLIGGTTLTTDAILDLQSTTKAFIPPRMTTTQRDAIGTPSAGMLIYNTTTGAFNGYTSSWGALGGGGIGGSTGSVDNAILRADGTGGSTLQSSPLSISDTGDLTLGEGSLAGTERSVSTSGSASDVSLVLIPKGSGGATIIAYNNSGSQLQLGRSSDTHTQASIAANGSNSNITLGLVSKGTGGITLQAATGSINLYTKTSGSGVGGLFITDNGETFLRPQNQNASGGIDGRNLIILSGQGDSTGNFDSGHIYLDNAVKFGTGLVGNIGLFTQSVADWKSMEKGLFVGNATTEPTAAPANGVWLWAFDVSSSSELKVMDEAGNTTVLSPHNWDLIGAPSEEMAWSYRSERRFGSKKKRINVDMLAVIREVEKIVGRKLVYEDEI